MLETLHAAELSWIIRLQEIPIPALVMKGLSNLGPSAYLLGAIGLIYLCIEKHWGARLMLLYFSADVVSYMAKCAFHSPRPFWMDERVRAFEPEATSYGFPSGHSLVATCVWFMFARAIRKSWVWSLAAGVVFLISLSRVWLGAHFFSDVVGGWLFGAPVLLLFCSLEPRLAPRLMNLSFGKQILLTALATGIILAVGFAFHAMAQQGVDPKQWPRYPTVARSFRSLGSYSGAVFGLGIGLAMAARWAQFNASGPLQKRFLRILIVAAPATLYWLRPKGLLKEMPDLLAFTLLFIGCTIAAWGLTFLVPWFFLRIGLAEPTTFHSRSSSDSNNPSNLP